MDIRYFNRRLMDGSGYVLYRLALYEESLYAHLPRLDVLKRAGMVLNGAREERPIWLEM